MTLGSLIRDTRDPARDLPGTCRTLPGAAAASQGSGELPRNLQDHPRDPGNPLYRDQQEPPRYPEDPVRDQRTLSEILWSLQRTHGASQGSSRPFQGPEGSPMDKGVPHSDLDILSGTCRTLPGAYDTLSWTCSPSRDLWDPLCGLQDPLRDLQEPAINLDQQHFATSPGSLGWSCMFLGHSSDP